MCRPFAPIVSRPAGTFSTDDAVADQRQIEAEDYLDPEVDGFTDDIDEEPCIGCGYIACVCGELEDDGEPCDQCWNVPCTCFDFCYRCGRQHADCTCQEELDAMDEHVAKIMKEEKK